MANPIRANYSYSAPRKSKKFKQVNGLRNYYSDIIYHRLIVKCTFSKHMVKQ